MAEFASSGQRGHPVVGAISIPRFFLGLLLQLAFAMWLGAPVALKTDTLRHAPVGDHLMPSAQRQHA